MFGGKFFALAALTASAVTAQTVVYKFDPKLAAGVSGEINVHHAGHDSTEATIKAKLDFTGVDLEAIKIADGNCTAEVTEYKWHIHVKWGSEATSASFKQCSLAETGNHYDPLFACGPNSEFAEDAKCAPKIKAYACNPGNYSSNFEVCEKGDLSGKFGSIMLTANKTSVGEWKDPHFPLYSELTPQWNMILHAVCDNKATPRIACAVAQKKDSDYASPAPCTKNPSKAPVTPAPTTQAPSTPVPTGGGATKSPAPCTKTPGPVTPAPTTKYPETLAPTTKAPATPAPTTPSKAPVTPAPSTPSKAPATPVPTGNGPAPTTEAPAYPTPTTKAPLPTPAATGNIDPAPAASSVKPGC